MGVTNPTDLKSEKTTKKVDIYRDTPVRYLGYANEAGEVFRSMIGAKWVAVSYAVATLYVAADTIDKTYEAYSTNKNNPDVIKKTLYMATDSFTWQMLASVVVPGYIINRTCALADHLLRKNKNLITSKRNWIVTAIGICTIPFIIKPIDYLTDRLLDETLRKFKPE